MIWMTNKLELMFNRYFLLSLSSQAGDYTMGISKAQMRRVWGVYLLFGAR
jgi:hypothetical protein